MNVVTVKPTFAGRFRLVATKLDGTSRVVADWFDNLILDTGLNRLGTGLVGNHCQVGTGATAPTNSDATLQSLLTASSTIQNTVTGASASSPYYGYVINTYRFGIGAAAGNLTEVGIGWAASGSLFSRSLIKDLAGDPTTITILGDEILDVQYELRLYAPLTDVTGTIDVGGDDYDYVLRASNVTTGTTWGNFGVSYLLTSGGVAMQPSLGFNTFFAGAVGAITAAPSGTANTDASYPSAAVYGNNNLYRDFSYSVGINHANFGGVGAVLLQTSAGQYQIGFTPDLPKDNTKTLTVVVRVAWARKVL